MQVRVLPGAYFGGYMFSLELTKNASVYVSKCDGQTHINFGMYQFNGCSIKEVIKAFQEMDEKLEDAVFQYTDSDNITDVSGIVGIITGKEKQ